jgi:hypothetical protein
LCPALKGIETSEDQLTDPDMNILRLCPALKGIKRSKPDAKATEKRHPLARMAFFIFSFTYKI